MPYSLVDIFQSSHAVGSDVRTGSKATQQFGRTFVENIVGKPGQSVKAQVVQETGPLGMLYLFAQVEPAYYLIMTKCVMPKDIKSFQDHANQQRAPVVESLKNSKLLPKKIQAPNYLEDLK